jgi:hypothetical protein
MRATSACPWPNGREDWRADRKRIGRSLSLLR